MCLPLFYCCVSVYLPTAVTDVSMRLTVHLFGADSVNEQKRIQALPKPDRKIAEAAAKAATRPEIQRGYLGMSRPHANRGSHSTNELERRLGPAQGHSKLGNRLLARCLLLLRDCGC